RIVDVVPETDCVRIIYQPRGSGEETRLRADWLINCMGPDQDYEKIEQPLIKNLIQSKAIHCDPAHLGINALPDGRIIQEDGTPSEVFFTLGLPLKGMVWEALAAPEIRVQAENLAEMLLKED
ncbi:MAG: FAD-dependent oxidoreductase, partial [Calditrichia bacterium]